MSVTATTDPTSAHAARRAGDVALVSPGWPAARYPNGIATYVHHLRDGLRQHGADPVVLAIQSADTDPARCARDRVVPVALRSAEQAAARTWIGRLRRRLNPSGWHDRNLVKALLAAIDQLPPHCGCVEMEESCGWAAAVARRAGRPVVLRLHGPWFLVGPADGVRTDREFLRRVTAEGEALRRAAAVIAPSYAVLRAAEEYYGFSPRHATVIPLPVRMVADGEHWRVDPARRPTILFVGRFDRVKGGDLVLQAFARVAYRVPGVRLVFVGPDRGMTDEHGRRWTLMEYARRAVAPEHFGQIDCRGPLPHDALDELRLEASVCLMASRYETFGYTALEAMALGCPLVAPRVGGLAEAVAHRSNGLLADPDSPEDLAARLIELLEHPGLAEQLGGQAASDTRNRNHPARIAGLTLEVYRAAVAD